MLTWVLTIQVAFALASGAESKPDRYRAEHQQGMALGPR